MRRYQTLTLITVVMTLVLIAVGSTVRTTGSGLGCPDWPLCHGRPYPPLERTAIIEYSHRTTAALVGALVLAQSLWTFIALRRDRVLVTLVAISLPLLGLQAYLGRVTVQRELPPEVVAIHLCTALILLALLGVIAGYARLGPGRTRIDTPERRGLTRVALIATGVTGVVLVIGAYTVATGAGYGCSTWPSCAQAPIPFASGGPLQDIHWLHRLTVVLGAAAVGWVFLYVRHMPQVGRRLHQGAHALIGLYGLQILIGAGNIWSNMAEAVRVAHLAVGSAVWVTLVLIAVLARFRPEQTREAAAVDGVLDAPGVHGTGGVRA
jgi:heme A synthase